MSRSVLVTACVAVLVTGVGMLYAFLQRPSSGTQGHGNGDATLRCGTTVCQSVIGKNVGHDMVEVLTGTGGGRIRVTGESGNFIFEMTIAEAGAQVSGNDALQCAEGPVSVCLVRGTRGEDVLGDALVRRDGVWTRPAAYEASGSYLALHDVNSDGTADVVAVQLGCGGQCDTAFVQVFSPGGADLGCTAPVSSKDAANRTPELSQLRPCAEP